MIKQDYKISMLEISLFGLFIVLSAIGLSYLYSASQAYSRASGGFNGMIVRQGVFFLIGICALIFGMIYDHKNYQKLIKPLVIVSFLVLMTTHIPGLGVEVKGAKSWVDLGLFRFQPSEIVKVVIVFYLSSVLAKKGEEIKDFYTGVFPPMLIVGVFSFLIFIENDFSMVFMIMLISMVIFYLAGIRFVTLIMIFLTGALSIFFMITSAQYRMRRVFAFLNPWEDPLGAGWQSIQAMKCFSHGGLFGVGLGNSNQTRTLLLPEAHNDYIFAVIAEEGGGIMAIIVLFLYLSLGIIGFNIAKKTNNPYSYLLASGFTALILFQAMINIGVVMNIFPSTGVTLPLISAGGTSLVLTMFVIGVLLNIGLTSVNGADSNE